MASEHTENYALNIWEPEDNVLRAEFNENFTKLDAAVAAKGNCIIVAGSYVGNGKFGANYPNTLTFPGKPLLVVVTQGGFLCAVAGAQSVYVYTEYGSVAKPTLTWGEDSLSWSHSYDAERQLNTTGTKYHYIALLAAD